MQILSTYEATLGQKVNKNKTTIFFNKLAKEDTKEMIKGVLGVQEIKHYEKYLGLPSLVRREKRQALTILRSEFGKNCRVRRVIIIYTTNPAIFAKLTP